MMWIRACVATNMACMHGADMDRIKSSFNMIMTLVEVFSAWMRVQKSRKRMIACLRSDKSRIHGFCNL